MAVLLLFKTQVLWAKRKYFIWLLGLSAISVIYITLAPSDISLEGKLLICSAPFLWLLLAFLCDFAYFNYQKKHTNANLRFKADIDHCLIFVTTGGLAGDVYDRKLLKRSPTTIDWVCSLIIIPGYFILLSLLSRLY
jgi:hypothetical protein